MVVPTYNRADLLQEQLDALAAQDYPQWWEVVVADNRSTDHTGRVLDDYGSRLPLRVVEASARQSRAYAINVGARYADGEALLWLDSDDVVAPGYLRAMGAALARTAFVGARLDTAVLNPTWLRRRRRPLQESELPVLLGYRRFVVGAAFGVRAEAFHRVGGCDEDMECLEDVDLSWRLQSAGYAPVFVPDAVVHYRYRQSLAGIWRQERSYGRWEAVLYAKHRHLGVPRRRTRATLASGLQILRALPRAATLTGQAQLVTLAGAAIGRIEGSRLARARSS